MAIRTHSGPQTYSKPPKSLTPGKFPPGHAVFQEKDKEMVVVFMGQTYNERGQWLPVNATKLIEAGYTWNQNLADHLRSVTPQSKTKTCISCSFEDLPMSAAFCFKCGAPQPNKIINPDEDNLTTLLQYMSPNDPFACLRPPQPLPERVTAEQLMPTEADIAADAYREQLPITVEAVPGEGAHPTKASASLKPHGQVSFESGRK